MWPNPQFAGYFQKNTYEGLILQRDKITFMLAFLLLTANSQYVYVRYFNKIRHTKAKHIVNE